MPLMVSDGIDRLGFLIHDVQRLMRKRFEARASGLGLSSAQWRLLVRVAKEAGVSQIMVSRFLSGKRDIRLATADRLAHVLGLKLVAR